MKIGIIGAMDEEITLLRQQMTHKQETTIANTLFIEGELANQHVVLLKSGIGKVNAAMATTIMHERFSPNYVINTGSAGGFAPTLDVGDVIISNQVVQYDVDVTAFDYNIGQVPGMPTMYQAEKTLIQLAADVMKRLNIHTETGLIATGDTFMQDPHKVATVRSQFPNMLAAEMEAGAIAQVCHHYEIPFVVVRALSDIAGKESSKSFDEFLALAAKNAATMIINMIKQLSS